MSEATSYDFPLEVSKDRKSLSVGLLSVDLLNFSSISDKLSIESYNTLSKHVDRMPSVGMEDDELVGPVKETTNTIAMHVVAEMMEAYGEKLVRALPYSKAMVETALMSVTKGLEFGQALALLTNMDKSEADRIKGMSDSELAAASAHMPKPSTKHNDNIDYLTNESMLRAYVYMANAITGTLTQGDISVFERCVALANYGNREQNSFKNFIDTAFEVLPNRPQGDQTDAFAVFRSTDNYSVKAFCRKDNGFSTKTLLLNPDSNDVTKDEAERATKVRDIVDRMSADDNGNMVETWETVNKVTVPMVNAIGKFIHELEELIESEPDAAIKHISEIRISLTQTLYEAITAFHFFYDILKGSGMRLLLLVENTRK